MPHVAIICKRFKTTRLSKAIITGLGIIGFLLSISAEFREYGYVLLDADNQPNFFTATNTRNRCNFANLFTFYARL